MLKKAQNIGQIFIYILSIVVVGVILLFGYQAITNFSKNADRIALVQFQKDLESSIKSISSQYGAIQKKIFSLSNDYKQVCFVDNYNSITDLNAMDSYPIIKDSVVSGTGKNIFLVKANKQAAESFSIEKIALKTVIFDCFNITNSKLTIRIEGMGDHAVISK